MRRGEITRSLHSEFYHPERRLAIKSIQEKWLGKSSSLAQVLNFDERLITYKPDLFYVGLANVESETGAFVETDEQEPEGTCRLFNEGDILYGKLRPYLNKVYIAPKSGQCSTEFYALSAIDQKKLDHTFLASFLMSKPFLAQSIHMMTGNTHPRILREDFEEILIPLPPLDVQKTLVAQMESARATRQSKLAEADNLLTGIDEFVLRELDIQLPKEEKRQSFAVKLSKIKQGRQDVTYYKPYYEKLVNSLNKSKFPKIPLEDISPDLVGGATPTRGDTELYAEDGIKFLRILNIGENEIILEDLNYIKEIVHNGELKRSQLAENDVLMTITGRVGTSAVVSIDILPANINQHIVRMRITHQECLPEYLAIYLNSSIGKALSNRGVTGGTRIALDYEVIKKIQIPLPPQKVQEKIIKELHSLQSQARQLRQEAESQWQTAKEKFEKALLG
ncbi:MAG: restriction endonuclease subunit S [Anaerolineales bacterium]|nr:restriction endonuclease subunit S [Anaerolineales bacterium]